MSEFKNSLVPPENNGNGIHTYSCMINGSTVKINAKDTMELLKIAEKRYGVGTGKASMRVRTS